MWGFPLSQKSFCFQEDTGGEEEMNSGYGFQYATSVFRMRQGGEVCKAPGLSHATCLCMASAEGGCDVHLICDRSGGWDFLGTIQRNGPAGHCMCDRRRAQRE